LQNGQRVRASCSGDGHVRGQNYVPAAKERSFGNGEKGG